MTVDQLIRDLRKVMSDREVAETVRERLRSFSEAGKKPPEQLFQELAFCILAANYTARGSMRIVEELGERLLTLDREKLAEELRRLGHRFPEARAEYLVEARENLPRIMRALREVRDEHRLRAWLAENVKGLGYKEASHFLRNIGFRDLAIIDFHILRILERYGVIEPVKTLTKKRYLEIESILRRIASRLGVSLAELDLYLWYMDAGEILK